jgi:hypothetical protein
MPPSDSEDGTGEMAIERRRNMSQQAMSCWDPVLDGSQKHDDEGQPFQVTEALDFSERSSEQLEWELTRWPEGAEL